jgi:hypothetical protein
MRICHNNNFLGSPVKKLFLCFFCLRLFASDPSEELKRQYDHSCEEPSPIYQHVPVLRKLAKGCSSVIEIGLWEMTSSWGLLQGLAESRSPFKSYLGIDPRSPELETLQRAQRVSDAHGIQFRYWQTNDLEIEIEPAELLFIDSLHTYCHLSYELEKFSPKITKYIAMHDTSAPWGERDDEDYRGDFSEYPSWIPRNKKGTWFAVEDFLARHPEWVLLERYLHCHGFTILRRKSI